MYQSNLKNIAALLILALLMTPESQAQEMLIFEPFFLNDQSQLPALADQEQTDNISSESANELRSSLSLYEQSIELTEIQEGTYSFELVEKLSALGDIYQQLGDHAQAITSYESAQYMLRINSGLFSLQQRPLVEKIIASHIATGNTQEARYLQEYLFLLYQKNYSLADPEYLSASLELVDQYLLNYLRQPENLSDLMNNDLVSAPPLQSYRTIFDPFYRYYIFLPRSSFSGFDRAIPCLDSPVSIVSNYPVLRLQNDPQFSKAHDLILSLLESELSDIAPASERSLQQERASIAYLASRQLDFIQTQVSIDPGSRANCSWRFQSALRRQEYSSGLEALEAFALSIQEDPGASLEDSAQAQLYLGDWYLAFNDQPRAQEIYLAVYEQLFAAGLDADAIQALMNPSPLVLIPAFSEQPYAKAAWGFAAQEHPLYDGYIDVFLSRTAAGEFRDINMLTTSSEGTPEENFEKLRRLLKTQSSRPTLRNGVALEQEELRLRYYYKQ
tara:strand:- start:2087 stop:3592 length:1506 start_codon:yes stop_codon:yes gene_type:complete